jgi:zinc protease
MITFDRFTLPNGLTVLFHKDITTPMAVVNTLYDVGARDESEDKTGFAHLFEHLMFGGSVNIPDFDAPLQMAGGESNAFTSNDITNYYDVLPAKNIETALWLESDRMLSLAFTPKSLEVQRNVVIEEFKQRYLNQPYGDVWLQLRPLAYHQHPYKWATIGKEIKHIEDATMEDVRGFFSKHYVPANAILCIAGNFELEEIRSLVEKWFGDIPGGIKASRILPSEPVQQAFREKTIDRKVPANAFYYAFKMPERRNEGYYFADVLSDALGRDKSSRLYVSLKKEQQLVSDINAYITGSMDEGLLLISGKLNDGISFEELDRALWKELEKLKAHPMPASELDRLMIKIKTSREFQEQGLLNRAMNYDAIQPEHLHEAAIRLFKRQNCTLLKVNASNDAE